MKLRGNKNQQKETKNDNGSGSIPLSGNVPFATNPLQEICRSTSQATFSSPKYQVIGQIVSEEF